MGQRQIYCTYSLVSVLSRPRVDLWLRDELGVNSTVFPIREEPKLTTRETRREYKQRIAVITHSGRRFVESDCSIVVSVSVS